ncbi:MAG: type IV toxin-antitoxin system AbiEi family antitoxin [Terriglobales bacterium]
MKPLPSVEPFLDQFRRLPFVKGLDFSIQSRNGDSGIDGVLKVRTQDGTYTFLVEQKRSYLDRGILNVVIDQSKRGAKNRHDPLLLLARFIPKPSAERLIEAGVNFLDQAGNMHLVLGRKYERTIVGNKEDVALKDGPRVSPATAQLLFTFATIEEAGSWSVRQLAEASGLGKSNVANVREQLVDRGVLKKSGRGFEIRERARLQEELLRGYEFALRPKLFIGRFRSPQNDLDDTIAEFKKAFRELSIRWSVTGGPAASALQKFYRGLELPIFIDSFPDQLRRRVRIIPDKTGPVIFLRSFGSVPFWLDVEPFPLAHPWLIYSELMNSSDPRAHEAAEELKREFLS